MSFDLEMQHVETGHRLHFNFHGQDAEKGSPVRRDMIKAFAENPDFCEIYIKEHYEKREKIMCCHDTDTPKKGFFSKLFRR